MLKRWTYKFIWGLCIACAGSVSYAQTQVDALNWVYTGDQPVDNYRAFRAPGGNAGPTSSAGDYILNFNVGTQDNRELQTVTVGTKTNAILDTVDRAVLNRAGNAGVTADRQLLWYDVVSHITSGPDAGTYNMSAKRLPDMETALTGANISHGTDNVFNNVDSNNKNNIERIDFIFPNVLQAQNLSVLDPSYTGNFDDQLDFGFPIIERGGNDTFKIAPILDINTLGKPSQYGQLLTVDTSDWGSGLLATDTLVVRGDNSPGNTEFEPSAFVTGQSLAATFITLRDLGLNVGESFYGYSLFGGDVDPGISFASDPTAYSDLLKDVTDQTVFPQNTGSANGGLDLVSGGLFFDSEGVPTTGFVTPTPIPPAVIPFHSDFLPGLLIVTVWFARRLKKRLNEQALNNA